jgi:peptidoglycan hydrolase-like protein with peptidoglycan-binding domain
MFTVKADVYPRISIGGKVNAKSIQAALEADPEGEKLLRQLQEDLKKLTKDGESFYKLGIDGNFGPGTRAAVKDALKKYGSLIAISRAARIAEVTYESINNTGSDRTNR